MQNGIGVLLLVAVGLGVAGYLGYQNKYAVKMCETETYKVTEAKGARKIEVAPGTADNKALVPCDEIKQKP